MMWVSACTPTVVKSSTSRPTPDENNDENDVDTDSPDAFTDADFTDASTSPDGPCKESDPNSCPDGYFCAALDGQAAKCFAEHTRPDGKSCTDHNQCVSMRCNLETNRCTASQNAPCTPEDGCGPGPTDEINFVCTDGTCKASTGENDASCTWSYDCLSGVCKDNKCVSGEAGSDCQSPDHCESYICLQGLCSDGYIGDACESPTDCASGNCVDGKCHRPHNGLGGTCFIDDDCDEGSCINEECTAD